MKLKDLRKKLDEVDKELVDVIAKRIAIIPEVAEVKKEEGIPRSDPEREKRILEAKRELAEEKGISPDVVEDIFQRLIQESHVIERKIIGK